MPSFFEDGIKKYSVISRYEKSVRHLYWCWANVSYRRHDIL